MLDYYSVIHASEIGPWHDWDQSSGKLSRISEGYGIQPMNDAVGQRTGHGHQRPLANRLWRSVRGRLPGRHHHYPDSDARAWPCIRRLERHLRWERGEKHLYHRRPECRLHCRGQLRAWSLLVTPSAPGGNGSIDPGTPQTVSHGVNLSFSVTPDPGYTATVGGTCGGTLAGTTYTTEPLTADCTVEASFAPIIYTVTPSAGSGGSINPGTPQILSPGATATFTVTP